MSITDRTRKRLWGLSGNECARCSRALVEGSDSETPGAIIGREAHIVAQSAGGPRGEDGSRADIDGYDNLILLCSNCHGPVDDFPDLYSVEDLRKMKSRHERKVAARRTPDIPKIALRGRDKPVGLHLMTDGDTLLQRCAGNFSSVHDTPPSLSRSQREVVGDFLESLQGWTEAHDDIGPRGRMEAGGQLQDELDALRDEGLCVYVGHRMLTLEANGHSDPWSEVVVRIAHARDVLAA